MEPVDKADGDVQDVDHVKFKADRLADRIGLDESLFCHTCMLENLLRTGII